MSTLYLIIGPGGVGKNTLMAGLIDEFGDQMERVRGVWTRSYRPGETSETADSVQITRHDFLALDKAGKLLAVKEQYGHWYGVPRRNLLRPLKIDKEGAYIVTWDGALDIKAKLRGTPVRIVTLFLWASADTLRDRMKERGMDPEKIEQRINEAVERELPNAARFDHMIDAEQSPADVLAKVRTIIVANRMKRRFRCEACQLPVNEGESEGIAFRVNAESGDTYVNMLHYHPACARVLHEGLGNLLTEKEPA